MYIDMYILFVHTIYNTSRIVSCLWSFESNLKNAAFEIL